MAGSDATKILVLGIGNVLLSDDGIGVHVIRALAAGHENLNGAAVLRDGGTIGLELLSEIEEFQNVIVVDAMDLGGSPGAIGTFVGPKMDRRLQGTKHSVHELALADVMVAAQLTGRLPARRALIGIQPESTTWGLDPTPKVQASLAAACRTVCALIEEWNDAA